MPSPTPESHSPAEPAAWLRALSLRHGFPQVAFARVGELARHPAYLAWLEADLCGDMTFLRTDADARRDPRALLAAARTVLCVAVPYWQPAAAAADDGPRGRVARYAWGEDYHLVLKRRLGALAEDIAQGLGRPVAHRVCVDSAPLLERDLAEAAGLGFLGKNTLLITPGVGSFTVLGEVLLDLEVPAGAPQPGRCGQCRLCQDVCPTGALKDAHRLDARRCISYLTIEHRGAIPVELRAALGTWIFGCDLCQDVCPWNAAVRPGDAELAQGSLALTAPLLAPLLRVGAAQFRRFVKRRALRRVSRAQLLRNVAVALGNAGTPAEVPALGEALGEDAPLIRRHVAWALGEIAAREALARVVVTEHLQGALAREADEDVRDELRAALMRAAGAPQRSAWAALRSKEEAREGARAEESEGMRRGSGHPHLKVIA